MNAPKPPFINLFDIAGILMLVVILAIPLWLLGSRSITGGTILLLIVLFVGVVILARKGK